MTSVLARQAAWPCVVVRGRDGGAGFGAGRPLRAHGRRATFAKREPVLRVKPGDVVETRTYSQPGDYYPHRGRDDGDTLVVKVKLRPNRTRPCRTCGRTASARSPRHAARGCSTTRCPSGASSGGSTSSGTSASSTCRTRHQAHRGAACADARAGGGGAPAGRRGVRRALAGQLRRQHGRAEVREGVDRLPAVFHDGASSTSATATRCRATARSAGRASRRRWTSPSSST
jgi:hypothetical protein